VLLLDEVLSVLDVLSRQNIIKHIRKECEERGAIGVYATHIFEGLEDWSLITLILIDSSVVK
jgi:CCR4-NOT complex subunit CAF16